MPADAFAVHGLTDEFLRDKPLFAAVGGEFLDFIGDSPAGHPQRRVRPAVHQCRAGAARPQPLPMSRSLDTVAMARQKFPGAPASLDALCRRFGIDNSNRTLHGALLDAQLLAEVYLELQGGRQPDLVLAGNRGEATRNADGSAVKVERVRREPRPHAPTAESWRRIRRCWVSSRTRCG